MVHNSHTHNKHGDTSTFALATTCGKIIKSNTEREHEMKTRLHRKVCKLCRDTRMETTDINENIYSMRK